jgi:ATP-dependent helicase/nuclease subunit A
MTDDHSRVGAESRLHVSGDPLKGSQQTVFERFHDEDYGRVCVDAGAGTGKTMTLIRTVAEAVVRADQAGREPFDEILLTTFSKEAAHELKTRLKKQLRDHDRSAPEALADRVWRSIETDADIGTIDSYLYGLLDEIALDMGLPTDFEIREGTASEELVEEVFADIEGGNRQAIATLQEAFPPSSEEYGPAGYRELIYEAQQKCREYCWSPDRAVESLRESLRGAHAGFDGPDDLEDGDDFRRLFEYLLPDGETVPRMNDEERTQVMAHIRETFARSQDVIEAFGQVLHAFEREYDARTINSGLLSYTDVTYLLVRELEGPDHGLNRRLDDTFVERWKQSLRQRYRYLFVDEFQDTSYAQCRVVAQLVRDAPVAEGGTQLLVIGDVKQSIYEWRSAEPELFNGIIETARAADREREAGGDPRSETDENLGVSGLTHVPLTLNFRSHPDIIRAANRTFQYVFDHEALGSMGDLNIQYESLEAFRGAREDSDHTPGDDRVHLMDFAGNAKRDPWIATESPRIADTVAWLVDGQEEVTLDPWVRPDADGPVPPEPGDVTLLFRARSKMPEYVRQLRERNLRVAVNASEELFDRPEVKLLVDILEWFANPHSRPSLLRILRSPLVAVDDETLRVLAREDGSLQALLDNWDETLPDDDRDRIDALQELRNDLRWSREEAKSDLVNKILRHSAFEAVVLAEPDALQQYGNLWLLSEVIDQWEEEELLAYRELVDRLVRLRDTEGLEQSDFEIAPVASEQNRDTVTVTTVHASKGREFPIVFLPDLLNRLNFPRTQAKRFVHGRNEGMALRPQPGETPLPTGVRFDGPDEEGKWISENRDLQFATCTGPIWLSDDRVTDDSSPEYGQFKYRNDLNSHLEREAAENWRNLYVAFTRATDHLFLGCCPDELYFSGEFRTWLGPIRDSLLATTPAPGAGVRSDGTVSEVTGVAVDDLEFPRPYELPSGETEPPGNLDDFLNSEPPDDPVATLPFRPTSLTASGLHDLLACPRRYQYGQIQGISEIRGGTDRPTTVPSGMTPSGWGDLVHEALEALVDPEQDLDRLLSETRRRRDEAVAEELEQSIVPAFRDTQIGQRLEARVADEDIFTEETFETTYDIGDTEVVVRGMADLLFRDGGDWFLVDYKTGSAAPTDSFKHQQYAMQLSAYAWLLERLYDIEVNRASLLYIQDEGLVQNVPVDPDGFQSGLDDVEERLVPMRTEDGELMLQTIPDPEPPQDSEDMDKTTACGSCSYAASLGGPCRFG